MPDSNREVIAVAAGRLSHPLPPWLENQEFGELTAVGPFIVVYSGQEVIPEMRGVPQLGALLQYDREEGWTWDEANRRRYLGNLVWHVEGEVLRGATDSGQIVEIRPLTEVDAASVHLVPSAGEPLYLAAWRALLPDWGGP